MANFNLNEEYVHATGLIHYDIESQINACKNSTQEEKIKLYNSLIYKLPGGTISVRYDNLKKEINKAIFNGKLLGDVNNDGKVDDKDAKIIETHINEKVTKKSSAEIKTLDINQDGKIDKTDVELIEKLSTANVEIDDESSEIED